MFQPLDSLSTAVYTWGEGSSGQLGHGDGKDALLPKKLACFEEKRGIKVKQVQGGNLFTLILTEDGNIWSFGWEQNGRLGNDMKEGQNQQTPKKIQTPDIKFSQISCCGNHATGMTDDGKIYTWGSGEMGQLGHASFDNQRKPHLLELSLQHKFKQVSAGFNHTCAVTVDGKLFAWGENASKDPSPKNVPCLVHIPENQRSNSRSPNHSCAYRRWRVIFLGEAFVPKLRSSWKKKYHR